MDHSFPHGPFPFSVNLPISPTFLYMFTSLPCFWGRITPLVSLFLLKQLGFVYLYKFFTHLSWMIYLSFSMISKIMIITLFGKFCV